MKKSENNIDEKITFGDLVAGIALCFLGASYKEATLEVPGPEKLIVNLRQFDCFTFVESMLALARWFASGKKSPREYLKQLKLIRYRKGTIAGYSSRLHYFTDWLSDNEKKKIIKNITKALGGRSRRGEINFMTTNCGLYTALKNKKELQKMLAAEKNLSRKTFAIIDKNKFSASKEKIKNGDIVAFASAQEGLDVAHVGFALWQGRNLYLLHAASKERAVVISKKTLAAYLKSNKRFTGVIVARPV
ncbi:MAG: DUF1460 domain-containing protein [Syntrophaceae bacterium]|nr:DUF1460 domain-containing protein [Syntrophaceae bacterium]